MVGSFELWYPTVPLVPVRIYTYIIKSKEEINSSEGEEVEENADSAPGCSCLPPGMLLSASWDAPVMLLSASWDAPVCLLGCSCLPPTLFRGFRFFAVQGFPWFPCSGVSFFPLFRGCGRIPVSGGAGRVPPSCLLPARKLVLVCGLLLRAAFGSAS